jgi:peptide/nickel transport system permease protein
MIGRLGSLDQPATISAGLLATIVALALLAPWLAPHPPDWVNLAHKDEPPSREFWLGTDRLGRDVLSRLLFGARISLAIGVAAISVSTLIGTLTGALAGYHGRRVDTLVMRAVDVMLALPTFFLLVATQAVLKPGVVNVVGIIALTGWMVPARLMRGQFLALRSRDFVEAARSIGCSDQRIVWRHILPNAVGPLVVFFTLGVADAILIESALSFLGLGVPPYQVSWGSMLTDAQGSVLNGYWWAALFPGLMILLTALSINLLGDGLSEVLVGR